MMDQLHVLSSRPKESVVFKPGRELLAINSYRVYPGYVWILIEFHLRAVLLNLILLMLCVY